MSEETPEQKLKRYEYVLDAQADEIDKLRAEVERLTSVGGAHSVLKNIYLDRELPESLRAKATTAALPMETPKLMPERAPLELVAEPPISLFEQAERRMRKQLAREGQEIEVQPNGEVIVLKPGRGSGNGNGQDDGSSGSD